MKQAKVCAYTFDHGKRRVEPPPKARICFISVGWCLKFHYPNFPPEAKYNNNNNNNNKINDFIYSG